MLVKDESQILDPKVRAEIISEIIEGENVERRDEFKKRHDVYKDNTKKWVLEALKKEGLRESTLRLMQNRAANISVCRKIVNKLARCYIGGVSRSVESEEDTQKIDQLSRLMDVDQKFKKADRYRELHKNTMIQIVPEKDQINDDKSFKLSTRVLPPWKYDVIESPVDREKPMVVILSDFFEQTDGVFSHADGTDQKIADSPSDRNKGTKIRTFIWWSDQLHFTTDESGKIINELSPKGLENPIQKLPFVNIAEDQDGSFWAQGGEDLVDGSILINQLMTDMFSIAYRQGWGQLVITGKNIPQFHEDGPHTAIVIEQQEGEPNPTAQYLSANPPLNDWMRMIEQTAALILSTNNLSPTNIANKLDASQFPSGISLLIEQSEATGNVEDKQKIFKNAERKFWDIVGKWQNQFLDRGVLNDEFSQVGKLTDTDVTIKFTDMKPVITEEQKLKNIEQRQRLGINEQIELLMIDDNDLTREEAEEKLLRIQNEKASRMSIALNRAMESQDGITGQGGISIRSIPQDGSKDQE